MPQHPFITLWDAIGALDLKPSHRAVLRAFARHSDWATGENARPKLETVARDTGYSVRQVARIVAKLVEAKLLVVREPAAQHAPAVYAVLPPEAAEQHPLAEVGTYSDRTSAPRSDRTFGTPRPDIRDTPDRTSATARPDIRGSRTSIYQKDQVEDLKDQRARARANGAQQRPTGTEDFRVRRAYD